MNLPDIAEAVIRRKEKEIKVYPVHSNHASEAGHECERYLYYQRTAWDKKDPHDVTMQFIFDGGNDIERQAIRELQDAGFNVVEQQRAFYWPDLEVTGRIDARIQINGNLVPLEVKGLNHREWTNLNSIDDMLNSNAPWVRRYPAQLLLYQMMSGEEYGIFYIKSKSTYVPKVIWCRLYDYLDYTEQVLKKLERVNKAVKTGQIPDRIPFDEKICFDCPYFTLCQPDAKLAEGAEILVDPELQEALERREQLKEYKKEYEEVDKYVKQRLKGVKRAIIGNFVIEGKEVTGIRKPSPGGPYSYWKTWIKPYRRG